MVKQAGNSKARNPTKKEKLFRMHQAETAEKLAKSYIYPIGIAALILFFIGLYGFLYYKSTSS